MKVYQVKTQKPSTHSIQWEHHLIHFVFYCSLGKRRNVHFKIFIISVFIPAMSQRKILKSHQWTCKFKCNRNFLCLVLFICFFVLLSWLAFGLFLFRCWFLFVIFFFPSVHLLCSSYQQVFKTKMQDTGGETHYPHFPNLPAAFNNKIPWKWKKDKSVFSSPSLAMLLSSHWE